MQNSIVSNRMNSSYILHIYLHTKIEHFVPPSDRKIEFIWWCSRDVKFQSPNSTLDCDIISNLNLMKSEQKVVKDTAASIKK